MQSSWMFPNFLPVLKHHIDCLLNFLLLLITCLIKMYYSMDDLLNTGILADDMGLGKTLQTIALILSNFKDGKPLAVPVSGKVRQSKVLRLQQKAQVS